VRRLRDKVQSTSISQTPRQRVHTKRRAVQGLSFAFGLIAGASVCSAQARFGVMLAGGYAAGVDSPVLADGALGLRAAVWLKRRTGVEFGVAVGRDNFEDRTLVTRNLYFDPASGGVGTSQCAGCLAGSAEQRTRMTDWYVTPTLTIRRRTGALQPYASVAVGAYQVRERRDNRFLPTASATATGASSFTSRKWTAGGAVSAGARLPIHARIALDVSTQLHGAALIGNDYAGGTGYAVFAVGVAMR
jgi:hypothetical protein